MLLLASFALVEASCGGGGQGGVTAAAAACGGAPRRSKRGEGKGAAQEGLRGASHGEACF